MFSIVMPLDPNRLPQFSETKRVYDTFPQTKEFLIPTRNYNTVARYLYRNQLDKDVKLIPYTHTEGFNPSMALNIGVRNARYAQVIITSPEVKPTTPVLDQLETLLGQNVVCQVGDEDESHKVKDILVCTGYRDESPAFYFLAMFNKSDIEKINGWDEEFMKGYAYEDNDFGARWNRAGLPFVVRDDIQAVHQYHPRGETIPGGALTNYNKFQENNAQNVISCTNGLRSLAV